MADDDAAAAATRVQASIRGRQARKEVAKLEAIEAHQRTRELRSILADSGKRVQEFFRMWDADGSGEVDAYEFAPALRALGLVVSDADALALFRSFDADGGGTLSHKEMYRQLRAGADVDLSTETVVDKFGVVHHVNVEAGSGGEIVLEAKNAIALTHTSRRKRFSALPAAIDLEEPEDGGAPIVEQLREILTSHAVRVIDLFRDWDVDQSGTVSRLEFCRSVAALGYIAAPDEIFALFAELDVDGSGTIDYAELNKVLRRGADIVLDEKLQDGAVAFQQVARLNFRQGKENAIRAARLAANDPDADPLASLRRASLATLGKPAPGAVPDGASSPRSFRRAALLFSRDLLASNRAVKPPRSAAHVPGQPPPAGAATAARAHVGARGDTPLEKGRRGGGGESPRAVARAQHSLRQQAAASRKLQWQGAAEERGDSGGGDAHDGATPGASPSPSARHLCGDAAAVDDVSLSQLLCAPSSREAPTSRASTAAGTARSAAAGATTHSSSLRRHAAQLGQQALHQHQHQQRAAESAAQQGGFSARAEYLHASRTYEDAAIAMTSRPSRHLATRPLTTPGTLPALVSPRPLTAEAPWEGSYWLGGGGAGDFGQPHGIGVPVMNTGLLPPRRPASRSMATPSPRTLSPRTLSPARAQSPPKEVTFERAPSPPDGAARRRPVARRGAQHGGALHGAPAAARPGSREQQQRGEELAVELPKGGELLAPPVDAIPASPAAAEAGGGTQPKAAADVGAVEAAEPAPEPAVEAAVEATQAEAEPAPAAEIVVESEAEAEAVEAVLAGVAEPAAEATVADGAAEPQEEQPAAEPEPAAEAGAPDGDDLSAAAGAGAEGKVADEPEAAVEAAVEEEAEEAEAAVEAAAAEADEAAA